MTATHRLITAAALLMLPTAALAAALPSTVYQSAATNPGSCTTASCTLTFPALPTGKYLKVDHFSCTLSADQNRNVLNMRVLWGVGSVQQSIYQRAELVGRDGTLTYWYVHGNAGFVIPVGSTPQVGFYASGKGPIASTCVISGDLIPSS